MSLKKAVLAAGILALSGCDDKWASQDGYTGDSLIKISAACIAGADLYAQNFLDSEKSPKDRCKNIVRLAQCLIICHEKNVKFAAQDSEVQWDRLLTGLQLSASSVQDRKKTYEDSCAVFRNKNGKILEGERGQRIKATYAQLKPVCNP